MGPTKWRNAQVGDKNLTMEPFIGELDHLKQMDLFKKEEQTQS